MKYLEREFYRCRLIFRYRFPTSTWFEIKDRYFRGIKNVTKRHRRSVISRHEVRLFGKHLRPVWTVYARPAKPIGWKKHGKWLYMPKRVRLE